MVKGQIKDYLKKTSEKAKEEFEKDDKEGLGRRKVFPGL